MKLNNKGFGLMEVLTAVIIMGILSTGMLGMFNSANRILGKLNTAIAAANVLNASLQSEIAAENEHDVYAVQFCPGYTVTYPSMFPEYGFCIEGELYATYWDGKNAFSTKLVAGAYMSTSTSAPCNFQYIGNCKVAVMQ